MTRACDNKSVFGQYWPFIAGSIQFALLIAFGTWAYMTSEILDPDQEISKCREFWLFIVKLKSIKMTLMPCVYHILDTVTDIGTAIEIYKTAKNEECSQLKNEMTLFGLSVMSMILYRLISAYQVWKLCGHNCCRFITQFIDLDLLYCVALNAKYRITKPSNPQKMIQSNEALFEAVLQSIIAFYYLIITKSFNFIVILSFIFSFNSITSKISKMDESLFIKGSESREYFNLNGVSFSLDWHGVCCECRLCRLECKRMCSWIYVGRVYLWRYCELLCRICLIVCMWWCYHTHMAVM